MYPTTLKRDQFHFTDNKILLVGICSINLRIDHFLFVRLNNYNFDRQSNNIETLSLFKNIFTAYYTI